MIPLVAIGLVTIVIASLVLINGSIDNQQELAEINVRNYEKQNKIAAETNNISATYTDGIIKFTNSQNEKIHIIQVRVYDEFGNFVESYTVSEIILGNTMSEILPENLAIPSGVFEDRSGDPSGNTFVGVTIHGVEFPILLDDTGDSNDNSNDSNDGDGDSVLDGIGVYLTIQNIGSNGMVYFGEEDNYVGNYSYQTDIRAYVEVDDTSNWGDSYVEVVPSGDVSHTYDTAGTYTVEISGDGFTLFKVLPNDASKLISVNQWADTQWSTMYEMFYDADNMNIIATDTPDLSSVTTMYKMFNYAHVSIIINNLY